VLADGGIRSIRCIKHDALRDISMARLRMDTVIEGSLATDKNILARMGRGWLLVVGLSRCVLCSTILGSSRPLVAVHVHSRNLT
jgi:hypothetical protein